MGSAGRRGSDSSDRQIFFAVKKESQVTFRVFPNSPPVSGFVMGIDDYHWVVYSPSTERVVLVHKSCPQVEISREGIEALPQQQVAAVREHTAAFRSYVLRTHFAETGVAS